MTVSNWEKFLIKVLTAFLRYYIILYCDVLCTLVLCLSQSPGTDIEHIYKIRNFQEVNQ